MNWPKPIWMLLTSWVCRFLKLERLYSYTSKTRADLDDVMIFASPNEAKKR